MLERRSWNTRYLSRRAFQNNFFLPRWQRVYSRRARSSRRASSLGFLDTHRDFFYLAAARRGRSVEISPRLSLSRNSLLSGFRCSFETDLPPPPPPPLTVVSRTRLITTSDDEPGFELFHGRFSNCETPTRYQATTDSSNSVIRTEAVRGGLSLRCHARNVKTHGRTKSLITARILRFFARLPFSSPSPREDRTPWWSAVQRNVGRAIRHGRAVWPGRES